MPTICLVMMVKNEAHIIRRALQSAIPYIDSWSICDTGSTDGTQAIIREELKNIPGELHEVIWQNFGVNRTQAVRMARSKADYLLILDADLVLSVDFPEALEEWAPNRPGRVNDWLRSQLTADAYELRYQGNLDYTNTRLVSTRHDWFYVGVTHEYITSLTAADYQPLPGLSLIDFSDGGNRSDKFERDIQLLRDALETDPENARYVFYLAQSYKDIGNFGAALHWYERRTQMVGFDEETWYSMYMMAKMMSLIGIKWSQVLTGYLKAYEARPTRLEPLYEIVKYYRVQGQYAMAFTFASIWGHGFTYPSDRLFIDRPVYTHLFAYEFWDAAEQTGHVTAAHEAFDYLIGLNDVPAWLKSKLIPAPKAEKNSELPA